MKIKLPRPTRFLEGLFVVGVMVIGGYGVVLSEGFLPDEASTGVLDEEIIPAGGQEVSMTVGSRFLTFSADPSVVVLQASSTGGNAPSSIVPSYRVFGDGRIEERFPRKTPRNAANISVDGIRDLLELIVGGGLMEWDRDRIEAAVDTAIGGHYSNPDASTVKLEVFLVRYIDGEGMESAPAHKTIHSYDTWFRVRVAPDIPELRAVRDVFDLLEAASQ